MSAAPKKTGRHLKYRWIIDLVIIVAVLAILGSIFDTLSAVAAFIGFILVFTAYRIWKSWATFREAMDMMETAIWGKPLREFAKGELRKSKRRIVWRRKHGTTTTDTEQGRVDEVPTQQRGIEANGEEQERR